MPPRAPRCKPGSTGCGMKRKSNSRRRSLRFGRRWQFTAATDSPAAPAEQKFSGFVTRITKQTTARFAKPEEKFWRIAACRACWDPTGRELSTNSKPSNAAERMEYGQRFLELGFGALRGLPAAAFFRPVLAFLSTRNFH